MLKNYFTIAIRNLARHRVYTFINIAGLAIGLACSTLILLYLQHEFSYNRSHSKADRIHRVFQVIHHADGKITYYYAPPSPFAPALAEEFPEVENATRFLERGVFVSTEGKESVAEGVYVVDHEFFNIFDFPLVDGDAQTGLQMPFSIFVTETLSKTLFGNTNPIGKTVLLYGKNFDDVYTIAEVHSLLTDFDFLNTYEIPLISGRQFTAQDFKTGDIQNIRTVMLNKTGAQHLHVQIGDLVSTTLKGQETSMEVIGVFDDFNYRSLHELIAYTAEVRTKEIGIRKVLGASEVSIVNLLTKEFLLLVGLASVLAWPVAYYAMGEWLANFAYRIALHPVYFVASTGVALVITLITIAYQAIKAARANPVDAV